MPLPAQTVTDVRELLKRCSVQIAGGPAGKSLGSGFFIDTRLVLTCHHVAAVEAGQTVEVHPFGRESRKGTVIESLPGNDLDLALVRTEPKDDDPHPAVMLDEKLDDGIQYWAVGYPKEELVGNAGLEAIPYQGHPRAVDAETDDLLIIEAGGPAVGSGLSGGAVLSSETGGVVALVQYSNDPRADSGGAAIPISRAARKLPPVEALVSEPPPAARAWRDALGIENWSARGKPTEWRRHLDLTLSGEPEKWCVKIDNDDTTPPNITVRDLPDDVSRVLWHWAQLRRVREADDVLFLGRLLAHAVFPPSIATRVRDEGGADELLVRLRVDELDSPLLEVPWEFAAIGAPGKEQYIAIEEGLGLVRVVPDPDGGKPPVLGTPTVLGVAIQPPEWKRLPPLRYQDQSYPWPKAGELMKSLSAAVDPKKLSLEPMEDALPDELAERLTWRPDPPADRPNVDVVHYIGFGHAVGDDARLALWDGARVAMHSADEVIDWVAGSGARLLVVELALTPFGTDPEPIPARTFARAIGKGVQAVIFTRFPVHPMQFDRFNRALYRELAAYQSVEVAARRARKAVSTNKFLGDAATFGSFTVMTGARAWTQLLRPTPRDPLETASHSDRAPEMTPRSPEPPPVPAGRSPDRVEGRS
jgi:hypothetical protein